MITRWRRPLAIAATVVIALGQWDRLASGKPFAVVTALGLVGFMASVFFLTGVPIPEERSQPDAWRCSARRSMAVFGFWALAAWLWIAAAAYLYSVRPLNFIVPAMPTLLMLSQLPAYLGADRIALLNQKGRA